KGGERILLVSWGNGCEAVVLKVTDEIKSLSERRGIKRHLTIKRTLDNYEKLLRWRRIVPLETAARQEKTPTSMASQWREHRSTLPLYGVKCKVCGTKQMFIDSSSSRTRICVECLSKDQFEPYRFADKRGKVASFSHDYLGASQDPPNTLTVVDFEEGGRGAFEMTDRDPAECKVGMAVEMTFRKIAYERGVHNYFWKCKPARD
ncbi:MAG TPA: OB-fold domain-containing protein, partial [Dehalococcoidia bacterium]|nr:OB-fold domain-containing protein [Dehalococcoidia bacterium]